MADLRIVDAPVLLQESITDDVKMPTGGLGNFSIRLGDIVWYVVQKEQLASENYVDLSSKGVKDKLDSHITDKANPHNVTKAQVGLGNVDNTADIDKPVSNAVRSAITTATNDMATKAYVNQKDNLKADKSTTLSGYGIVDAYTKTEADSKISALSSTTYAGHKGYPTLAAAKAAQASLPANTLVEVTNDSTTANNGVYTWDGTTLTKSNNDVLGQAKSYTDTKNETTLTDAKSYTDTKTSSLNNLDVGNALFASVDANDNVVEVTAPDGNKYLVGLTDSVQNSIKANQTSVAALDTKLQDKLQDFDINAAAIAFVDAQDKVLGYIRTDSHLMLNFLSDSVQNEINNNKATLTDISTALSRTESPAVYGLIKGNYTFNNNDILSLKFAVTNATPYLDMDSPYRKSDAFVHPCVIELYQPLRGYKYLLCITPYWGLNPVEENPVIYGSNDQVTWKMLTGFDQPLDLPPEIDEPHTGLHGYLSDNWWSYDPINKELYCCYRKGYYANYPNGYNNADRMQLLYRKTTNGLTWSKPTMLTSETALGTDGQVAPSMVWDNVNKRWVLFYFKAGDSRIYVRFNNTLSAEGWTEPQEIGFKAFADSNGIKGWHLETKFVGNKLVMLIGSSVDGKYYFAVSNDDTFLNWSFSTNSILDAAWKKGAYKGSFIVVPQSNGKIKIRLYFTDSGNYRRLYTALSSDITIA